MSIILENINKKSPAKARLTFGSPALKYPLDTCHFILYTFLMLHEKIKEDMKDAMRAKNEIKVMTLRGLLSAFTNELVAQKKKPTEILDDEAVLAVINRAAKQCKDSIEQFEKGGRSELAESEKAELEIIKEYLPQMMSQEEILPIAEAKKKEMGIEDESKKGQLVGAIMKELKGKADGGDVKEVVEKLFS